MDEVKNLILINSELEWLGPLRLNEMRSFTTEIKFPWEGKWNVLIRFLGKSWRDVSFSAVQQHFISAPPAIGPYYSVFVSETTPQLGFPKDYSLGIIEFPTNRLSLMVFLRKQLIR